MKTVTIATVGDRSEEVFAHRCIPKALALAGKAIGVSVVENRIQTADVLKRISEVKNASGVWLTPGSPYESMAGALAAVKLTREEKIPFLGTCGGFQHALIEVARDLAGLTDADHAETSPDAPTLVVTRLSCSLVEQSETLAFAEGSIIRRAYGAGTAREGYRCNYGMNGSFQNRLEEAGLRFPVTGDTGEIRGGELTGHPFFVGTLFQPERSAESGAAHPLITAFVRAASVR